MRIVVASEAFGGEAFRELAVLTAEFEAPVLGLATGNTPGPMYAAMRERAHTGAISFARFAAPFAIDEYGVADRDHPCSNRAYFKQHWDVIPYAKPVRQFDPAAASPDAEVARFAGDLAAAGGLDVAILGIGLNGHLAFNEPGSKQDSPARVAQLTETTRSAATCFGTSAPAWGMTLGLAELLGARGVLLLASGAAKAAVVARALEGDIDSGCPASFLQQHKHLTVVLDREAATLLS